MSYTTNEGLEFFDDTSSIFNHKIERMRKEVQFRCSNYLKFDSLTRREEDTPNKIIHNQEEFIHNHEQMNYDLKRIAHNPGIMTNDCHRIVVDSKKMTDDCDKIIADRKKMTDDQEKINHDRNKIVHYRLATIFGSSLINNCPKSLINL